MLVQADSDAKVAVYAALGIRLTCDPSQRKVLVGSQPVTWALERLGGPTGSVSPRPVAAESGWSELRRSA